ncbi:MAG: hypothetical protein QUS35_04020 [bacterium]|nr:hypothetical protein [bacterium]
MKTLPLIPAAVLILIASGCEVRNPVADGNVVPVLSRVSTPDSLMLGDPEGMSVSIRVTDPQGRDNIAAVLCRVYREEQLHFPMHEEAPVHEEALLDNGVMADILPSDGVFSGRISGSDLAGAAGLYLLGFQAVDRDGNSSGSILVSFSAVAGVSPGRPVLSGCLVPDSIGPDGRSAVDLRISVTDPDGPADVDSVFCDVYPPYAAVPAGRIALFPARDIPTVGAPPDEYFTTADMRSLLTGSGVHRFRFCARDKAGLESIPVVREVPVVIPNDPPVLSGLSAPDTVDRNSEEPILLSIAVTDPQGASDIRRVYFNTTKPNGAPSSGNPFLMVDDGTSGDAVAGDGVYSLQVVISASNTLGNYRFDFYAQDNAGAVAGPVTRVITVIDSFPD